MTDKSVITFYRLSVDNVQDMTWEEASKFVDRHYGRRATCANVVHTDLEPEDLATCVRVWRTNDKDFRAAITQEKASGANFIFVAPVVGNPMWGHPLT